MIKKMWSLLFLMILLSSIPILVTNFLLQQQTMIAFSQVGDQLPLAANNREHLELLKRMKQLDPINQQTYREKFNRLMEIQWILDDWHQVRSLFMQQLIINSLIISGIVLLIAMILSYYFARKIVKKYANVLASNQAQVEKLKGLEYLKQWQQTARILAHELKTPMTPMRLIATDLFGKYQTLSPDKFHDYLMQTSELLAGQVQSMDELVQNLLAFGKFPAPKFSLMRPVDIFKEFGHRYQKLAENNPVQFIFPANHLSIPLAIDLNQIIHLLYNLVANAMEANKDQLITISFSYLVIKEKILIKVANSGNIIVNSEIANIFSPNFSNKNSAENPKNLGLGLTIAKKIALDHGGDLQLMANDPAVGVVFGLELPINQIINQEINNER